MRSLPALIASALLCVPLCAQHDHQQTSDPVPSPGDLTATTEAMGHSHHDHEHMGAHMHMSTLRDPQPGDAERAEKVVEQVRPALEKYRDYKVALAEGFKIFLPNVPQKMYHFTSWRYAMGEAFRFDPTRPTSLLYEKHGNDYTLI